MRMRIMALLLIIITASTCKKDVHVNPKINAVEPGSGISNDVITVTGSGLQDIQTAVFDLGNIPVTLNQNFNTNNTIIFRVPANANTGAQHIVFTNSAGYQFGAAFTVKL